MKTLLFLTILVAAIAAKPAVEPASKMGFYKPIPRITNGDDAAPGQFPHQISYQWGSLRYMRHMCGGSIISPTWIVTAAHCITDISTIGDHVVVAGITNLSEDTAEKQEISVAQYVVHPDYPHELGPNDIGLLRLSSPLVFGDLVKPISLPESGAEPTGNVVLSGWGSISTDFSEVMPQQLQTVTIPLLTYNECHNAIDALLPSGEVNPLSEALNICTGPLTGGISSCNGDSGGPLVQNNTLVGIVSWGFIPCGFAGAPSVFTKVSKFNDFIAQYVDDLP